MRSALGADARAVAQGSLDPWHDRPLTRSVHTIGQVLTAVQKPTDADVQARCQDLTDDARLGFAIIAGPGVETEGVTGVVQRMLARLKDKPVSVSIEQQGVDLVFGILGTHNLRIYRALAGSAIRHLTPRHEQGAGYTADRYARAGAMAAKTRRQASGVRRSIRRRSGCSRRPSC